MYSILKSQKRCLNHQKNVSVTFSVFLNNNHILLAYSDASFTIYHLNMSQAKNNLLVYEGLTSSIVIEAKRLTEQMCVLVCKNLTNVYVLEFIQNNADRNLKIELKQMKKSTFAQVIFNESQNGLLNAIGCQIRLHAFLNKCFILQYFIFDDRKIIFDCYQYVRKQEHAQPKNYNSTKMQISNHVNQWNLSTLQIDIQLNGNYIVQTINKKIGQIAIYKQSEINQLGWTIRVFSPFYNIEPSIGIQKVDKQVKIMLPQDKFNDDVSIIQICQFSDNSYLIITSSKTTSKLQGILMYGLSEKITGNVSQNIFSFKQLPQKSSDFLNQNFIKILAVNNKDQIFYVLSYQHQIVDGELYFNGIIIANLRTGKPIQRGYCTLRNIDFSPNYRYILDVPYQYDKICQNQTLFHIRLLLSKSSLYMFLIQQKPSLKSLSGKFKNTMIQLL